MKRLSNGAILINHGNGTIVIVATMDSTYENFNTLLQIQENINEISLSLGLEPIPDYGDLMTKEDFFERCQIGAFINYDGFGHFASKHFMSGGVDIKPSMVKNNTLPDHSHFTHIVWFNR